MRDPITKLKDTIANSGFSLRSGPVREAIEEVHQRFLQLGDELSRFRDIHHEKCSLNESDHCDCQQNAGRVWIAKALNGCEARAGKAETDAKDWELTAKAYEELRKRLAAEIERLKEYLLEAVRHHWDFDDCASLDPARWEHFYKIAGGGRESGDDSAAALEFAKILSEQGIESSLTPRFKLMGKTVKVKAAANPADFVDRLACDHIRTICEDCADEGPDGRTEDC